MNWSYVVKNNKLLELVKLGKITTLFPPPVFINFLLVLLRELLNHKKWALIKDKMPNYLVCLVWNFFSKVDFKIQVLLLVTL